MLKGTWCHHRALLLPVSGAVTPPCGSLHPPSSPQPPEGGWRRQPGPRLHHLLLLLPHRGLHLHRDGCRNPEAVGAVCVAVRPSARPRGWGLGEEGWGVGLHSCPPPFRFPSDLLLTSSTGELWRMVRIGGQPLGFGECGRGGRVPPLPVLQGRGAWWWWWWWGCDTLPACPHGCVTGAAAHPGCPCASPDECGIVAQIAEPLAAADISAYYISTFNFDHALVRPCPSPGTRHALGGVSSPGADTRSVVVPPQTHTGPRGGHR